MDTKPPQLQERQPGLQSEMRPEPQVMPRFPGSGRLAGKTAIVTGGDSGIGQAVAVLFAREGANVAILYLDESEDARKTAQMVRDEGRECLAIAGDVGDEQFCRKAVQQVVDRFGGVDVLVNNAAEQHPREDITEISREQLERTFRTNIFGYFFLTQSALPHMREGGAIVNTTSVTAYRGSQQLLDYSSTKGAIVAFTRALAQSLVERKIRVNGVAPGPIWTPLIPSTFDEEKVKSFGENVPMGRPGEPNEVAPCHLFLACDDASYMTGQVLHPNGGEIVGG
jgi:NAD(P)-dependent dehydrogenase (short-subunit alcohol dehydrogenase family)